jgi:hypothetical protein
MPWNALRFLAAGLACCALPSVAAAESLTPERFRAALAAAKSYAADRTLVFYCLRQDTDLAPHLIVHVEIADALAKFRAAGADSKQNAELIQTVMTNIRFPAPGATDAALDVECKVNNVAQSYYLFRGSFSVPLDGRPPFDRLTR